MNSILKYLSIGVLVLGLQNNFSAQCTNAIAFGTAAAPTGTASVTVSTCTYQTEYNTINGIVAGNTYTSSNSLGGCITVRSGTPGGPVVASGNSPLSWTATVTGTYYIHYNTNCACGTATGCGTTTITCTSCGAPPPPPLGSQCTVQASICSPGISANFPFIAAATGPPVDYANPVGCSTGLFGNPNEFGFILLYITTSGPLNLNVDGNGPSGFMDIIVYNIPPGVAPCTAVMNSANEIGCNFAPVAAGCTQFGNGCACASSIPAPNVVAGQTIMVIAHDWSNAMTSYNLQLCGGGAQTGPFNGTVNPAPTLTTTGGNYTMSAVTGGGTWSATCGACINATTGVFNPALAGPGTYQVCYTVGTTPCQGSDCEMVTVTAACSLTASATGTNVTCNGANNGTVSVSTNGANAPYTYTWTPGGVLGASRTNLPPGTYSVLVTGTGGCTATASYTVTQPTVVNITTTPTNATCVGNNGSIATTISGGTTPYSYSWNTNPLQTTQNATNLSPGNYTLTVSTPGPCTYSSTASIIQTGTVTSTFTYNGNQCLTGNNVIFTNTGTAAATHSWNFGNGQTSTAVSPSHTYAAPGTYTVTHTVTSGVCTSTTTQTVTIFPMPTSTITGVNPLCNGQSNGNVNLTPSGGNAPYSFAWSNGAITEDLTNVPAGTYNVTINTVNGCPTTNTFTLTNPPVLTAPMTGVPASCAGVCNGTATATPAGGTAPYSYLWSNGQTTQTATGLCAGSYNVTVTDANGCTVPGTFNVVNATTFSATASTGNASCGTATGSASATPVGGTGPFIYSWTPFGQTTQTINLISAGAYNVTITDNNGCQATTAANVINTAGPTITIPTTTNVSCFGGNDGTATALAVGGTAPITYAWTPTGGTSATGTGLLANTVYIVTVTDANNCQATATTTLTQPTQVTVTTSSTPSNCGQADGSVSANGLGGTGAISYSWVNGGGTNVGNTATVSNLLAGTYTVTATDASGCSNTATATISNNSAGSVSVVSTNSTCSGACNGSATATVTGGTLPIVYSWSNGATGVTATGLCPNTYTITATDGVGCILTTTATITEPTTLTATISNAIDVTCFGLTDGSAQANPAGGNAPYTFSWNTTPVQTTAIATNLAPGGYSVTITDANNCQATASITINEPAQLLLSGSDIDAHCNLPDGSATVAVASGGVAPFTYSWTANSSTTATATNVAPGTITATVVDATGCSATQIITVGNIPAGTATITNIVNPLCFNDCNGTASVSMSGSGTAPYTYLWSNGNTNQNATGFCNGAINVTVTDANGCTSTANDVMVEPILLDVQVAIISQPTCFGVCDGVLQAQIVGGTSPYSVLWDDPLGQVSINASGLCGDGTVYIVDVEDANGCVISKGGLLTQPTQVTMTSTTVDASCGQADGQGCVVLAGGTAPYNVVWQFDNSTNLCANNIPSNTYVVDGFDANGCDAQISVTVSDLSGPSASITSQTNVSCFGGSNGSATAVITGGLAPFTYQWDANAASQTTPTASNLVQGTYTLTITDANGCSASTSATITQPDDFVVQGVVTNPTCFEFTDGQIAVTLTGGITPYTYSWNDPSTQTTATASGLGDGAYTVVITDANGCSTFQQYNLFEPLQLAAFATNTPLSCNAVCNGTATATFANNNGAVTYLWNDGNAQTTATASGLCAGNYQVTITDNSGCTATTTTVVTEPTLFNGTIDLIGNVTCHNACDGFANAAVSGGTAPYTFLWSNGTTTPTISNVCDGNYTVVATDANGCQINLSTPITQPTALTTSLITSNVSCYGGQNGQATLAVAGGTAPYTYLWDDLNFQTTSSATTLFAGNYIATITDTNGCVITQNANITQPNQMVANVNVVNSNCGQNNGSVCVNIAGGILPYTFTWNDPNQQTSACVVNILGGTYTVTVIDANNCVYDSIINVNNIVGPSVTFNSLIDPSCNGLSDASINMTAGSGTLPYATYNWTDASGTVVGLPNTDQLNNISDGCYTLTLIDAAGCQASNTQCVTQPNALNSVISTSQNVTCNLACDGTATVASAGGVLPHSISWNNAATTAINPNLCAGTYQATITDANGCTSVSSVTITEPVPLVTAIVSTVDVTCSGLSNGQVTISVAGGTAPYLHTWNPLVSSTTVATNLSAGGYNVQTTDANGCIANVAATVNAPAPLTGTMTVVDATCGNCNGQVTYVPAGGTSPYSYSWDNGQTAITATNVCAGIFGGTVTDANGCTFNTIENVVNIAGPTINTLNFTSPTCNGLSNATATPNFVGGTAPFQFNWPLTNQNVETAVALAAGTHCVTITDANGCQATSCAIVTQPNPIVSIPDGATTICFGSTTQIWASGSGGTIPYTINWTSPNASSFTGQGPINVNPEFTNNYCFNVVDANGCMSPTSCVNIVVAPALSATLPANINICSGDDYTIVGNYSGGNGNPYTYSWHQGNVNSASIGSTANLTVIPTGLTTYFVVLNDGCSAPTTAQIEVGLNPLPAAFLNVVNPNECAPGTINFIANSDIGITYGWDFECDGTIDQSDTTTTSSHVYSDAGVYDVCLTVTTADGCVSVLTNEDAVEIYPNPIANFTYTPGSTTINNPYVNVTSTSIGAFNWSWDFNGDGSEDASTENATFEYLTDGTYPISLVITNQYGCIDSITIPFIVFEDQNIFIPNAFTPDDDGTNDFFFVDGIGLDRDNFDLYVFNRWGEIIWESHNPDNQWDGTMNNVKCQQDVYVWLLITKKVNGTEVRMNGNVTLVR